MQDCSAEGTWGNESPHFGYTLARLGAHGRKLAEQEFFRRMLVWRLENRGLEATKSFPEASKSRPRRSKIEPGALQDAIFKDIYFKRVKPYAANFCGPNSQLGSKLEAQEGPKSRPRREKIDVENQFVFSIDF